MEKIYSLDNILVLDIGGSSIKYGLISDDKITLQGKEVTPQTSLDEFYQTIDAILDKFENINGIAISMPGVIDSKRGIAHTGGALDYIKELPLVEILHNKYHKPVWIGNDAKCAGLAEHQLGNLKGYHNGIVIVLGTGVGGCFIINDEIVSGSHLKSGEVSSMIINYNGTDYYWYELGGILGLSNFVNKEKNDDKFYNGETIFDLINKNDQDVIKAIDKYAELLAKQLFNLQCCFDVDKILIGGGISQQSYLINLIRNKFNMIFENLNIPIEPVEIDNCAFYNDANLIGAYCGYKKMFL